jgi:hypothetical protein
MGSQTHRTQNQISQSHIRDFPNLEVPVFISLRKRMAQLYSWALDSNLVASYDSQGYDGGIRTRLHAATRPIPNLSCLSRQGQHRIHRSSGMTHSIVVCAVIGTDCAENTIPLLFFMSHCLVTTGCCDSTILASSEYVISCQVKLYYDRRSADQSVLLSGIHLGPAINFSPSFFNYF